ADIALKRIIHGLHYHAFASLPAEVQHGILFDQTGPSSFARTILLLNETGALIADGGPLLAPRDLNAAEAEFFKIHKDHSFAGLFISRPYESLVVPGRLSIAISRRLADPDGRFAGVV